MDNHLDNGQSFLDQMAASALDQAQPDDHEAFIAELAALPLVEYEQRRGEAAKQIRVRTATLDKMVKGQRPVADDGAGNAVLFPEVTPWALPVDGGELLDDLSALIGRYLVAPKHADHAMALWIVFTHAIDAAEVAPILMLKSAEKRCGKTTALSLIQRLSYRALPAANITAPALFRSIEAWAPTLLIDEADMFLKDSPELNGIINSGHTRPTAFVIRTVGEDFEPRKFSTWGAKAIASIGGQSTTLHDRSIIIELRRKLPGESAEKLRHADRRGFERITQRIVRFAKDNQDRFGAHRPNIPDVLNDRAADNWEFLLAIADVAGGRWPELARQAAIALSGAADDAKSVGQELLEDIREIFDHKRVDRISTGQLLEALCADDEKSWAAFNRGKPMTAKQLAKRLHEFKIISRTVRIGHTTPKGYMLSDFDDAFARYVAATAHSPATTAQAVPTPGLSVAVAPQLAATQNAAATLERLPLLGCGGVAEEPPVLGEEAEEADEWL
jgi:putative DNA primase/helicase